MTPEQFYGSGRKYKVLWLLHGTFGDHTDWVRKTNIEMYAVERNLAVVMPSALNSNYSNWNNTMLGFNMYDFLTEELMPLIYGWLPVSDKREDNFIAGSAWVGAHNQICGQSSREICRCRCAVCNPDGYVVDGPRQRLPDAQYEQ